MPRFESASPRVESPQKKESFSESLRKRFTPGTVALLMGALGSGGAVLDRARRSETWDGVPMYLADRTRALIEEIEGEAQKIRAILEPPAEAAAHPIRMLEGIDSDALKPPKRIRSTEDSRPIKPYEYREPSILDEDFSQPFEDDTDDLSPEAKERRERRVALRSAQEAFREAMKSRDVQDVYQLADEKAESVCGIASKNCDYYSVRHQIKSLLRQELKQLAVKDPEKAFQIAGDSHFQFNQLDVALVAGRSDLVQEWFVGKGITTENAKKFQDGHYWVNSLIQSNERMDNLTTVYESLPREYQTMILANVQNKQQSFTKFVQGWRQDGDEPKAQGAQEIADRYQMYLELLD